MSFLRFAKIPVRQWILMGIGTLGFLVLIPCIHGLWDIELKQNAPSIHLLDRNYQFIAAIENSQGDFGYWDMPSPLPQTLVTATLAAEDRRFHNHWGVDFSAVAGALYNNVISVISPRPYRGASTIAMQVARLQHGGGSGWYYKIHDAVVAMGITIFYGREKVLDQYFRLAPYGNRMAGAACASRRYFQKPVQDLSLAEACLLAAIPKAPSRFNLFKYKGYQLAQRRATLILKRIANYGWVSENTRKEALLELRSLLKPEKEIRKQSSLHFLRQSARSLQGTPQTQGEIRTPLDSKIQDSLVSILGRELPQLLKWQAGNSAAMVLDVKTGEVLAYVGSYDYYDPRGGAIDCAQIPRSTGSLLKPFIYALGMEWQGFNSATILTDMGFDFGSGKHSFVPENFDRKFQGPVLYKNALANSRNIPAVEVLRATGVDLFYSLCISLGLTPDDGKANYYGLGLSIGGLYSTLQQICAAYLSLANLGQKRDLVWQMDRPLSTSSNPQLMSPDIAMQITRYLSDPLARLPSFPRGGNLEYPFAVAAKTGTSEGFRDSWCVAFSDQYLIGVWVGNTDFSPTNRLSGYSGAASIVKKMMLSLHVDRAHGLSDIEFPPPPTYVPVPICRLTGKRADRFTPFSTTEYFRPETEPLELSTVSQLLPVDKRNGLLAFPPCKAPVEYRRYMVLEPKYQEWARSQGLEIPPDRISPACGNASNVLDYTVAITSPRSGSRFFMDPEMPAGKSLLPLTVKIFPQPSAVLWFVNGVEYKLVKAPFTLMWPMKEGEFTFQAVVPGTEFKSHSVKVEVY